MRVPAAAVYFPERDRRWILERIDEVLEGGRLTLGPYTRALEEEFARLCGVRYAVATASGTAALEMALRAVGVEGQEVVVPANTFFATAAAVLHAGGVPRFVDCEAASFALDPDALEGAIGPRTAAVIVVHIGGIVSPHIGRIAEICRRAGVPLLEDAAHAHGSSYLGQPAGSFGLAAAFSFYPTKVVTSGEGGMLVTNDEGVYREALIYRDQGKERFDSNRHVRLGYNWRMSEVHAVIGLAQVRRLDEFVQHRRRIAALYDRELEGLAPWVVPLGEPEGVRGNYYKYICWLHGLPRDLLKARLRAGYGVALSGEVYELPCHRQPCFAPWDPGVLPVAERICACHICLPISARMTEEDALYVVASLRRAVAELVEEGQGGDGT
ncbi:MAG TPA: DegT/DnrJ/EryC1/StrS family aminotransferase [Dehalococcoidia bacterium]|nr:DegT/DnrJ/EryC1/StrS family aminotransferase [Dehalococcoidia bacterium]